MRPELMRATELIRSDNVENLNEAISLLQTTVFSFSMKVCGHHDDAEDTMQEVLLKALPYLREIESPQALAVWLYKVTRNHCWMNRRRSKFAPVQTLSLDELMPDDAELVSLTQHLQHDPESAASSKQDSERVRDAVLRIPPKYRIILVLHDMEDLDTREVAQILGLSEGTVRVRLHRARLFVRRELAHEGQPRPISRKKARKPVDCRSMFSELSEFIDGHGQTVVCEKIQRHLEQCPPCIAFVEDLKKAIQRCKEASVPCSRNLSDKVRNVLVNEYLRLSDMTRT